MYKRFKTVFVILVIGITILFSPFVLSQSGKSYFEQGVKAAKSGNHSLALKQFQKAKKAGLDTAALQYNFGVVYYKLGQYEKAKKAFMPLIEVKKYQQHAYYNLGLVANKQKNKKVAIDWFQKSLRTGKSDTIKNYSREAIKKLSAAREKSSSPNKKWRGSLSASMLSDSNVTQANDDQAGVTNQSDNSMVLSAYGANWLTGGRADGVRLFLRGYSQSYSTQTTYNYALYGLGGALYNRFGSWNTRIGGFWDEMYLGGSTYQRITSAEMRVGNSLSKNTRFRMRYKVSSIDAANPAYDYLGGIRQQVRIGTQTRYKTSRYRVYYQFEHNDREDYDNPAGTEYTFKSYSPTRHTLRMTAWWDVSSLWKLRLDGRYRASNYKDDHILVSSATERREDKQTRFSLRLSRQFSNNLQMDMTYRITNNDSSIDSESYDQSLASLGLSWKL